MPIRRRDLRDFGGPSFHCHLCTPSVAVAFLIACWIEISLLNQSMSE
jgi:hypothetical protein